MELNKNRKYYNENNFFGFGKKQNLNGDIIEQIQENLKLDDDFEIKNKIELAETNNHIYRLWI